MSINTTPPNKTRRKSTAASSGMPTKIRLAMGILLLIMIVLAVLLIYQSVLKRSSAEDGALNANIISYENITLPDWITEDLIEINEYSRPGTILDEMTGFVVHYTGNPGSTAVQNRSYFNGLAQTKSTYASSNFIIDTSGDIILCVPLDEVAYASNSRNNNTLSIEVCHPDETGKFTDESYNSLIKLLSWLCDTYNLSANTIIRHGDIIEKNCPLYYMQNPDEWEKLIEDVKNY